MWRGEGWLGFPDPLSGQKPSWNFCDEFGWSSEGPISQSHYSHLHNGAPGIFSDLLRSVQMLKRDWVRKATGSYRTYSSLVKLQPCFLSLRWKTCLWAELQPWYLSLLWKTCPWAEHSDDYDGDYCEYDFNIRTYELYVLYISLKTIKLQYLLNIFAKLLYGILHRKF